MALRKTKIVGTLGPASSNATVLRDLIEAGLDVVRLNCSHSSHDGIANRGPARRGSAAKRDRKDSDGSNAQLGLPSAAAAKR